MNLSELEGEVCVVVHFKDLEVKVSNNLSVI